jgi:hypothetical protein
MENNRFSNFLGNWRWGCGGVGAKVIPKTVFAVKN